MARNWAGFANLAERQIAKNGRSMTVRKSTSTPNVLKPWEVTLASTDYTVIGVEKGFTAGQVDGQTIRSGDTRFLIDGKTLTVEPQAGWIIVDSDVQWRVVSIKRVNPGDLDILYTFHVRSAMASAAN